MSPPEMPRPNHEHHLCYLENVGYLKAVPEAYKQLVGNRKYEKL